MLFIHGSLRALGNAFSFIDDMPEKIKLELVDSVNDVDFSNQSNTSRRRIYTELLKKSS